MSKAKKPASPINENSNDNSDSNSDEHVSSGFSAGIELEQLGRQVAELTEALQRERADSTNIRRRHE